MVMFQLMHSSPLVASQALTQLSSATDLLSFEVVRLSGKNNALECNNTDNQSAEKLDPNTLRRYRDWLVNETNPRWNRINRRAESAFLTGSEDYLTDINKMMRRKNSQSRGTVFKDEPDTPRREDDLTASNNSAFEVNNPTEFPYLPSVGDQYAAVGSTQIRSFTGQDDNELLARLEYLSGQNKDLTLANFRSFFINVAAVAREDYVLQYEAQSSSENGYSSSSGDNGVVQHDPRYKPNRSKPSTNPVTVGVDQPDDSSGSNEVGKQKDPTVKYAEMFRNAQEDIGEELNIEDGMETERNLIQKEQQFYKEPLRPSFNNHAITKVSAALFGGDFFDQLSQHGSGPSRYQKNRVEMEVEMEPIDEFDIPSLDLDRVNPETDSGREGGGAQSLNTASLPTDRTERRLDPNDLGAGVFTGPMEGLPYDRLSQKSVKVGFAAGRNKFDGSK